MSLRRPLVLAAALLGCSGCVSRQQPAAAPEPFVFRALDLQQQDRRGSTAWRLRSPEARYDVTRQLAQARDLRGTVFKRGKPQISISARRGTVLADGQAIQLEGDVQITLLGKNPVQISGDQVRWFPSRQLMVIDRRPAAIDRRSRITARIATYHLDRDLVELRGDPRLEQWSSGSRRTAPSGTAPLQVHTAKVNWRPEQGDINASDTVRGTRRDRSGELQLSARALSGNLRAGFVDLLAPVQVRDPKRKGWLQAQQTRWQFSEERLSSDRPFSGQLNKLKGSGNGFTINLARSDVLVNGACRLLQPGEQLEANRCLWHWPSGRFNATGAVVLRRATYHQITRASTLQGRIGTNGTAVFSAPGSRVHSQVTLPPGQSGPSRPKPAARVVF